MSSEKRKTSKQVSNKENWSRHVFLEIRQFHRIHVIMTGENLREPIIGENVIRFFFPLRPACTSSQILPEPTDTEMDVDVDPSKDIEDPGVEYDLYRHRSPVGPPPPNTPGVHVNRKESCCSDSKKNFSVNLKFNTSYDEDTEYPIEDNIISKHSMSNSRESHSKRFFRDSQEKGKEKLKRELSIDGDKLQNNLLTTSLCSICEKKKRISWSRAPTKIKFKINFGTGVWNFLNVFNFKCLLCFIYLFFFM